MTHDDLEKLFRYGDSSNEAIKVRMEAARRAAGLTQTEVAAAIGVVKQTYHSQETRGAPKTPTARYFYRAHGFDFNYLFHGDFDQLTAEAREKLVAALLAEPE